MNESKFVAKREISMKRMLTALSDALALPELKEGLRVRNIEFEATLPDVRIDCLLFLTPEEMEESRQGPLKDLGTINVLHFKAIRDKFTVKDLQTYLGQGLIVNGSEKVDESEKVVLSILCSEPPSEALDNKIFKFESGSNEPWVYANKCEWFFPVRIVVLNDIDLTDENLPIYFPFVPFISNKEKFLEFFPKIASLEIPEAWKLLCELFASKVNPRYKEVRRMIYWLTADDIQIALGHVREEEMPAVLDKVWEQIPRMPADEIPEVLSNLLNRLPPEQRMSTLNRMKSLIPKEQLKEWAQSILAESE